jgi:hypothetical protein
VAKKKTAGKASGKRRATTKLTKKKASVARPTRSSKTKRGRAKSAASAGDEEVTLDRRRGARRSGERQTATEPASPLPKLERRQKVNRRRQIDPTTCERDYTDHEVEFMNALDDYKRRSGRMFPTCSEVLEVIRSLGYVKLSPAELTSLPGAGPGVASAKPMPNEWPTSSHDLNMGDDDANVLGCQAEMA